MTVVNKYMLCLHNNNKAVTVLKTIHGGSTIVKDWSLDINVVNTHLSSSFYFEDTFLILQMKISLNPGRVVIRMLGTVKFCTKNPFQCLLPQGG